MNTAEDAEKALLEQGVKYLSTKAAGILGWGKKHLKDAYLLHKASSDYVQNYERRHGSVKVLGMTEPVPLRRIYTTVQLVTPENLRPLSTVDELHKNFISRGRFGKSIGDRRINALTAANQQQYLNILGQPGAGKSTFLRRIGLESFTPGKLSFLGVLRVGNGLLNIDLRKIQPYLETAYEHECVPVYIELKTLKSEDFNLLNLIEEEFATCGFPEPEIFVKKALNSGKLLLLLDGLDEVPTTNLDSAIDQITRFVDRFPTNRFVTSCRTAFYKSFFKRFKDVVIADFDDIQVEAFIRNWFVSQADQDANVGAEMWSEVSTSPAVLELGRTPLLLTFLCLVYDSTQALPANRSDLYEEALRILLERWGAEKRIRRNSFALGLSSKLELLLLQRIAGDAFSHGKIFFSRRELLVAIEGFLQGETNIRKDLIAEDVLEATTVQQGILVERALDVYSFSHLTLQEYLSARYLLEQRNFTELIKKHLLDPRWREVFLLLAGLTNADELLTRMVNASKKLVSENERLQRYLKWVHTVVGSSNNSTSDLAKRAVIIFLVPYISRGFVLNLQLVSQVAASFDFSGEYAVVVSLIKELSSAIRQGRGDDATNIANEMAGCARAAEIFGSSEASQVRSLLHIRIGRDTSRSTVPDEVANCFYSAFHLPEELIRWTYAEAAPLRDYLATSLLCIDCKQSALSVSAGVWEKLVPGLLA